MIIGKRIKGWHLFSLATHEITQIFINIAYTIGEKGDYEKAIENYDKAIELNPTDEGAWYNKGWSLEKLGRKDEAELCFQKAKELGYEES